MAQSKKNTKPKPSGDTLTAPRATLIQSILALVGVIITAGGAVAVAKYQASHATEKTASVNPVPQVVKPFTSTSVIPPAKPTVTQRTSDIRISYHQLPTTPSAPAATPTPTSQARSGAQISYGAQSPNITTRAGGATSQTSYGTQSPNINGASGNIDIQYGAPAQPDASKEISK